MQALPTPPALMRQFEKGMISREELHQKMSLHAQVLIDEMEMQHANPVESLIEQWRNRMQASRLAGKHGELCVREVFHALSELDDFPPAQLLWNAAHPHMPLFCFIRMQSHPLFRVVEMQSSSSSITIEVEYTRHKNDLRTKEKFHLIRNRKWILCVASREQIFL
jgi:hypothetical protein